MPASSSCAEPQVEEQAGADQHERHHGDEDERDAQAHRHAPTLPRRMRAQMRGVRPRRGDGRGARRRDDGRRHRRPPRARRARGCARRRVAGAHRAGARARCSRARAATSRPGCSTTRRRPRRVRAAADVEAAVDGADLVIEAVPEDPELKAEILASRVGRAADADHRHQHLLAADRRAGRVASRGPAALPRRALVQPAGVDAGHRGDRRARDRPRGRRAGAGVPAHGRQAARRGRRPRRLRLQPPPDGAAARGARDRRRGPDHARGPRRDRAQHVRLPAPVLRPVPDRRHGRARHLRRRLQDARARRRARSSRRPHELRERVEAGRLGTKSGEGFRRYSDEERDALLLERDRRYAALARLLAE